MKNIFKGIVKDITTKFNAATRLPSASKAKVNCNYSNNYYGDQVCQSK